MSLSLRFLGLAAICSFATCFPIPPPPLSPSSPPTNSSSSGPSDSFQNFLDIHVTPTTSEPPATDVPIGFHIQLGHNTTAVPGKDIQLGNYIGLMKGMLATGPISFEAYNGSFCPPVTGYYYLGAIVHLTSSLEAAELPDQEDSSPLVTVSICLAGSCSDDRVASLETVSSSSGRQTVSVSGILSLNVQDTVVLRVRTNAVTAAIIHKDTSFMGFLWGQSSSL